MYHTPNNEFQFLLKTLSYLRTHWWLFALEVCVVFSIWLTKFYRTPNVYESRAQILIDSSTRQMYQSVFLSHRRSDARRQNMVHMLRSPGVMNRFRDKLTNLYQEEGRPHHLRRLFPSDQAYPSDKFLHWISLSWNKSSDTYGIRCIAMNPDAAHDMCRVYLSTLQEVYPKFGQRGVQNKRDFLARQIGSLQRQIVDREMHLAEFEKENTDFMNFMTAIIKNESLQNLRNRLRELKHKQKLNRAMKKLLVNSRDIGQPDHSSYKKAMGSLDSRLSELLYREHMTEQLNSHDRARRLAEIREEIEDINAQIATLSEKQHQSFSKTLLSTQQQSTMLADLEVQYHINQVKVKNLATEIGEIDRQKAQYRELELEYNKLKSEAEHKTRLLTNLYKKEQETEIELSAVRSEVFKLQLPTRTGHRVEPQLSKHIFAAISLSIFVIVATAILLAIFFPRIDNESEVHKLNLPVLGKVPVFKDWFGKISSLSPFALEYLKIMSYRILRETKNAKCPIIIVTSPQAGEGKSTVTYFLSVASQAPGRKCLYIDGDLITTHPNSFFGVADDETPGLRKILESDEEVDFDSLVVKTEHEGIHFMPRGGRINGISAPNFLQPLSKALEKQREKYDIIFIDTPPLFASSLAHQWAGMGDLIVLVARMFQTRPKDIIEGLQTCKIFSKAPVGVALNCLPMYKQPGRGSYYYYFSRYYPRKKQRKIAA